MESTPDTPPVTEPVAVTEAITALPLLHAPPVDASVNIVEVPGQIDIPPKIGAGSGFTVIVVVVVQPPGVV